MSWMKGITLLGMGGFAATALALGCSSTPDVPPDPLATEGGFCTALSKAVCGANVVNECFGSSAATLEDDTKSCVDNAQTGFCNAGNLKYRPGGAQGCIDAYKKAYADAKLDVDELEAVDIACHPTLSGNGSSGDSCEFDSDCNGAEQLRCVIKTGTEGSCRVPVEVMAGDKCGGAAEVCPVDRYCNSEVDACISRQAVGDVCSATQPCDADSYCDGAVDAQLCVAKDSNTTTCVKDDSCSGGFCDIDDGDIDGSCKAALPVSDDNGECAGFIAG